MVVNVARRFIFIHVPKAAGTSLTAALAALPGNHTGWLAATKHETLAEFQAAVGGRMSAAERSAGLDPAGFFTCGFVRNPWDRMASLYRYLVERRPRTEIDSVRSFKDLLLQARDDVAWIRGLHSLRQQVDFFTLASGERRLGFLGHVECMQEDAAALSTRLGCNLRIPELNRSENATDDYRRHYDREMIDTVALLFPDDVRDLGYHFDTRVPVRRCSGGVPAPVAES
jgi:hypothetical protein